jgi:CMP-N-acetylneuraminic acid synthetase
MKAHSARVAGKNFRTFAGKPLLRWILDTLIEIDSIERVVINTDARATLEELGVHALPKVLIRDRKPEICGDLVSMNRVLADDLEAISSESYLMTHTTNPLLGGDTIRSAIAAFQQAKKEGAADSLFSVNKYQSRFYSSNGRPINHDPNNLIRTQDLEPWYEENSNLYLFTRASFGATGARIGSRPMFFETPRRESFDIDDQVGWEMAEVFANQRKVTL